MSILKKILKEIEKVANEHPYKVPGKPETYGSYNEAWQDCSDRISGIITGMMEDEKSSDNGWIPVEEKLPDTEDYILISFKNFSVPAIGRYEKDKDGSGAFYIGDELETCIRQNLYVNAWQQLPVPYRPKEEDDV